MIVFDGVELLNVTDIAEILKIEGQSVTRLFRQGKISGRKLNRQWHCTKEALKAYLVGNAEQTGNDEVTA